MKRLYIYIFYMSAFFMPWGEGMQQTFSKSSSVFPACCLILLVIYIVKYRNKLFAELPQEFNYFSGYIFIHTCFFVFLNPDLLSFGTQDINELGDGFSVGKTSIGDSVLKFFLFMAYSCCLVKSMLCNIINPKTYFFMYGLGFCLTIILGGFSMEYGAVLRISGGLSDPNAMAVDALVALALSYYLAKTCDKSAILIKYSSFVFVVIALYAVFMSFSRGALLSLIIMLFTLLSRKYRLNKLILSCVASVVVIYFAYLFFVPTDIKDILSMRLDFEDVKESGGANRTNIWVAYLERWPYYFIQGSGFCNCTSILKQHSSGITVSLNYVTHNQYLLYFVEQGLIGFILYFKYILLGYKQLRVNSDQRLILLMPFVAYTCATFFVNLSGGRTVWLVFALVNYVYILNNNKYENPCIRSGQ